MKIVRKLLAGLWLAALVTPVLAESAVGVWPKVHTVEQANATLLRVEQERSVVNDAYGAAERVCYEKFFVNACLGEAKETRRVALALLRAAEVDAEHFKRADSVEKRDADLAERARKDAEEQAQRAALPPKAPKVVDETPVPAPQSGPAVDREAQHAQKLQKLAAQDAAREAKRAENLAAFERKQQEALRRQAAVAKKKAENEARLAASEAARAKAAAKAEAKAEADAKAAAARGQ